METYARQRPCTLYFVALKVTGVLGRPIGTLNWALTITSFLSEFSNKPRIFIACLSFLTMSPLLTSFFLFLAFDNHLRQFENKNCVSRYLPHAGAMFHNRGGFFWSHGIPIKDGLRFSCWIFSFDLFPRNILEFSGNSKFIFYLVIPVSIPCIRCSMLKNNWILLSRLEKSLLGTFNILIFWKDSEKYILEKLKDF